MNARQLADKLEQICSVELNGDGAEYLGALENFINDKHPDIVKALRNAAAPERMTDEQFAEMRREDMHANSVLVTEKELQERTSAPRVHQSDVDAAVLRSEYTLLPDGRTTICLITMRNGFTVRGESSCVFVENYRKDIGERIAREDAYDKVWAFLGFALADRRHAATQPGVVHVEGARAMIIGDEMNKVNFVARVCHEVNRAYCEALGDTSQKPWNEAPNWQRESARMGVDLHLMGNFGPEASHLSWMAEKQRTGWTYGPVKDEAKKEHPCMVPFAELPREQQAKDFIFRGVVHALK